MIQMKSMRNKGKESLKAFEQEFYEFTKGYQTCWKICPDVEFPKLDAPYFDLSFQGTPNKEMVRISPSVDCL